MHRKWSTGEWRTVILVVAVAVAFAAGMVGKLGFPYHTQDENTATAEKEVPGPKRNGAEIPAWDKDRKPKEQILERYAYTASYNCDTRCPNWVGWVLTAEHTDGEHDRKGMPFFEDTDVPRPRACNSDIKESLTGYQRGHICPAGDNKWSRKALRESFLMTNICPQNGDLNEGDWRDIEIACREWARKLGKIYIVSGPVFYDRMAVTIGKNRVAVPQAFFKAVLYVSEGGGDARAIGFVCPNAPGKGDIRKYACPVDEVEKITGLDLFHVLDDSVEDKVESEMDPGFWFGEKKGGGGIANKIMI